MEREEMRERIARALYERDSANSTEGPWESWDDVGTLFRSEHYAEADAVLAALSDAPAPTDEYEQVGWRLLMEDGSHQLTDDMDAELEPGDRPVYVEVKREPAPQAEPTCDCYHVCEAAQGWRADCPRGLVPQAEPEPNLGGCPYYRHYATNEPLPTGWTGCGMCVDEPSCVTDEPEGGWPQAEPDTVPLGWADDWANEPQAEPDRCPTCGSKDRTVIVLPRCTRRVADPWHTEGADR